ncbi:MAG: hypothetical protein IKJ97_02995, partial [Bacteroidaceae bacterium]|nr:hypothetical protein [Bacteroidaceae bacterium]
MDTNNKNNNPVEDNNITSQDKNVAQNEVSEKNNKSSFMENVNSAVTKGEKIAETAINAAEKAGEVGKT